MGAYWWVSTTPQMENRFFPWYLELNAKVSAAVVDLVDGDDMNRVGKSLVSPRGSISVERGCDAIAPTALFVAAVLASPASIFSRLSAAVLGSLFLAVVNVLRVVTLYLTNIHWKKAFDVMHLEVWQAAFILLAIILWALWAAWVTHRRKKAKDAPT